MSIDLTSLGNTGLINITYGNIACTNLALKLKKFILASQ